MDFSLEQHKKRGGQVEEMNGTIWVARIVQSSRGWGALCLFYNKDTMLVHREHENSSSCSAFFSD